MKNNRFNTRIIDFISGIKNAKLWTKVTFIVFGISSTVWFLIRVLPKPTRATYPCMRAAAPVMSSFVAYLLSLTGSALVLRWFHRKPISSKFVAASTLFVAVFSVVVVANVTKEKDTKVLPLLPMSHFEANNPIGTAAGFKPGRVVWVWDRNATNENFKPSNSQSNWWANQTNKEEIGLMFEKALLRYTDKATLGEAWDVLFKYFNEQHGKGNTGYKAGEKIYIKVNITNSASGMKKTNNFDRMDVTPEVALTLLKHLVDVVGVAQSDICLGDPFRNFHNLYWDMCHSAYPNVVYCDGLGIEGRHQTVPTTGHVMVFSDKKLDYRIPQEFVDASYIINMPCLKTHNEGGITLGAKNHQGSVLQDGGRPDNQYIQPMHYSLPANNLGYGKYRHLVDYLGHKDVGGKTLVTIIDGIWAGRSWEGFIEKWQMAPFNNDYPSSIFISQDRVAIDAVCYDFLLEEYKNKPNNQKYPYFEGCDDYLFQAADPSYWPSGLIYDPEGDGTPLTSMGVYEHWNNPTEMKYSRNLGTGNGIELIKVNLNTDPITPENSGLVSPKVNKIFIDSFDVKWFGTDKGISRFDGENWTLIDTSNFLRNNTINDIVYEKTRYGNEIWVATNGGLSVMSYDVDGVTSATTYYVGGPESGIISDTVTAVGLDKNHNRWIATPKGINTFGKNGWDTTYTFTNYDREEKNWNRLIVNSIGSYDKDGSVYMGTSGEGVLRMAYSELDGFTGASAMSKMWSGLWSDTVHAVAIYDTIQWYGTNLGVFEHFGPSTKNYWDFSITPWDNIINPVVKDIEKDDDGNIWIGTEKGLHIVTPDGILKYATGVQTSNIAAYPSMLQATIQWTNGNGFTGSMLNEKVNDIQKDFSGKIWIASDSGVEIYKSVPGVPKDEETKRVVFATKSSTGTITPIDGTTYDGKSEYKAGTLIGNWYCVYNGTDNAVDITGLSANTTYRVAIFDYYGEPGHEKYSLKEGSNNPISFTTTAVGKDDLSSNRVKAFPIPFNDFLMLHLTMEQGRSYIATISNLDGKVYRKVTIWDNDQRIETSDLPKGAYFLKITDGTKENVLKIIK